MRLKYPKGISKCKPPKMTNVRGRTWDICDLVLPDGTMSAAHLDTSWGTYFYFQAQDGWHCGKIDNFKTEDDGVMLRIDLSEKTASAIRESEEARA